MRGDSIPLSPKHGVNPSLLQCFVCGVDVGVALLGRLPMDAEAPRHSTTPHTRCKACQEQADAKRICLMLVRGESGYEGRLGDYAWVDRDQMLDSVRSPELRAAIANSGYAYIPLEVWQMYGLPIHEKTKDAAGETPA